MLGQKETYSYCLLKKEKKTPLNHGFQRSVIKFLFGC